MFEQATLTDGPAGKRALATFIGFTSQAVLLTFAVMAPMVWPQMLPTTRIFETLAPPVPASPTPKPLGGVTPAKPTHYSKWSLTKYQPTIIPTGIQLIVEEPVGITTGDTAVGVKGGSDIGGSSNLMNVILGGIPVAPPRVVEPPAKPPVAPPAIQRFTVGGNVHLGAVLHKSEPAYPAIAKAARVSGDVELECVVGVDGHIHEVKVRSGNGLLVRAAVEAAWQWIYTPSQLNGVPIEIITILKFSFKLN
jgi:protein TonB